MLPAADPPPLRQEAGQLSRACCKLTGVALSEMGEQALMNLLTELPNTLSLISGLSRVLWYFSQFTHSSFSCWHLTFHTKVLSRGSDMHEIPHTSLSYSLPTYSQVCQLHQLTKELTAASLPLQKLKAIEVLPKTPPKDDPQTP